MVRNLLLIAPEKGLNEWVLKQLLDIFLVDLPRSVLAWVRGFEAVPHSLNKVFLLDVFVRVHWFGVRCLAVGQVVENGLILSIARF